MKEAWQGERHGPAGDSSLVLGSLRASDTRDLGWQAGDWRLGATGAGGRAVAAGV